MNGPGDTPIHKNERHCSLISFLPALSMSCKGHAETFARSLQSKLRTLGAQATEDDSSSPTDENSPIIHSNSWNSSNHGSSQATLPSTEVTSIQPLPQTGNEAGEFDCYNSSSNNSNKNIQNHNKVELFYDFECELESPGSPANEADYVKIYEAPINHQPTFINSTEQTEEEKKKRSIDKDYGQRSKSNCVDEEEGATSQSFTENHDNSNSFSISTDDPFYDPENSEFSEPRSLPTDYYECDELKSQNLVESEKSKTINESSSNSSLQTAKEISESSALNSIQTDSSSSEADSFPPSQESTSGVNTSASIGTLSSLTFTGVTSASNNTLQDLILAELQQTSAKESPKTKETGTEESIKSERIYYDDDEEDNDDDDENIQDRATSTAEFHAKSEKSIPLTNRSSPARKELELSLRKLRLSSPPLQQQSTLATADKEKTSKELESITDADKDEDSEENQQDEEEEQKDIEIVSKSSGISDNEEEDDKPERIRRCSSLKTGKTPPGTPGSKKIVRFADVLGLDLADVKTFLDDIPYVPKSAYSDLECIDNEPPIQLGPKLEKILMPLFQQPVGLPKFLDVVREKQVCLENAAVTDTINMTITGIVRVRNLDFHKSVYIRYTIDNWKSFADLQANYVPNSCDGFSDKFSFTLFGNSLKIGQRIEFAARFHCKGQQYWDSNYGLNYCFQCLPASPPLQRANNGNDTGMGLSIPGDTWCGSLY